MSDNPKFPWKDLLYMLIAMAIIAVVLQWPS